MESNASDDTAKRNAVNKNGGSERPSDQTRPAALAALRLERKRELAFSYRLFAAFRWGDLGDGHITARDPQRTECFWVLRSGLSFHRATIDDLVLVDPAGDPV
ncbi:MAG: class II aldolase/adducin family protein, partial [Acidimicrobiales bacterium]